MTGDDDDAVVGVMDVVDEVDDKDAVDGEEAGGRVSSWSCDSWLPWGWDMVRWMLW